MGILLAQKGKNYNSNAINKIPDYARDYRNEYLFIRGINKTCGELVKKYLKVQKLIDLLVK